MESRDQHKPPPGHFDAQIITAATASQKFHLHYDDELIRGTNIASNELAGKLRSAA
jgi:hypothetical protein